MVETLASTFGGGGGKPNFNSLGQAALIEALRDPMAKAAAGMSDQQLADLASRGVLRSHAEDVLEEAYGRAVELAVAETSRPFNKFPETCPHNLDALLAIVLKD